MTTGVIVARFQSYRLHKGHVHLIDEVIKKCNQLVICLGTTSTINERNILPFHVRKEMILELYPSAIIHEIEDHREDLSWSKNLDSILDAYENVTLYGSRDSFISLYSGKFNYVSIPELSGMSATNERENMNIINNEDFRKGFIIGYKLSKTGSSKLFNL